MCYSPSPPPSSNAIFPSYLTFGNKCSSDHINFYNTTSFHCQVDNSNYIASTEDQHNMQRTEDIKNVNDSKTDEETASDYKQWLHAMKLVARLPGGIPPEFRRKLWLSLADKYLKSKNVDWATEEEKCFREKWREDDEELGIQIVKDLHRTGSTLCTGPAGDLNQAKLKRILLGYARYNTEVGYCQGFNMLGALILQVMDKHESESIKVMIYLVEGILPPGYFCGSMGGLQADMAVFRELMQTKLPRLAKHLQKLQGPIENAYEPPLTNVFTMQWFLTMFCTCLPMSCVLRVWDLVLIEGSDVLLRTALVLWSLLEERVLSTRSADDFYGKMGSFSSELLNGHLIDSNGLIEKVVQLGPITDIQKLREKHLCSVAPIGRQQGLQIYFDDDEPDMDEDSRLAVATVWGIPWVRRGSHGQQNNNNAKQTVENKDRIALDISLLKKQYDKLRERQKQAQIILTTACSSAARQSTTTTPLPVNQLLSGRPAIVTNKGRRSGPPTGAIPPARKPSLPAVLHDKPFEKQLKRGETLLWRDTRDTKNRRDSLSWKEIKAERAALISSGSIDGLKSQKIRSGRLGKSDSSSYSEESDDNDVKVAEDASSSDTSLDEDELQAASNAKEQIPNIGNSHKLTHKALRKSKKSFVKQRNQSIIAKNSDEKIRPKSWAPSNSEIPFVLMTADSPNHSADENPDNNKPEAKLDISKWENPIFSSNPDDKDVLEIEPTEHEKVESPPATEVLSPGLTRPLEEVNKNENIETFDISSEGVTNEYFERINSTERPTKLDLFYSLNEDEPIRATYKAEDAEFMKSKEEPRFYANGNSSSLNNNIRCMDLLVDYSEKSSAACIEEAKSEISVFKNENGLRKIKTSAEKRRDPRRLTLTRSSTMDIEKRFEAFEKRFSMELCTNYTKFSDGEAEFNVDSNKRPHQGCVMNFKQTNNIRDPNYNTSAHEALAMGSNNYPDKKIPSTADLEERFENIQQQLVRDRNRMNKSPCDSDNTEEQSTSKTSPESNIRSSSQKGKTDEQPQKPDEVEEGDRTEGEAVLSRQSEKEEKSSPSKESEDVSKSSGTKDTQNDTAEDSASTTSKTKLVQRKKEPPDENTEEDNIQRDSLSRKKSAESEEKTTTSQKPSPGSEEDAKRTTQKTSETVGETTGKSPITAKKPSERSSPPSTEELEKRFSALTEQMKSEKNETKAATREVSPKKEKRSTVEVVDEGSHACTENLSKSEKDCDKIEDDISNNLTSADPKDFPTKSEFRTEKTTHRRLSEPPSTEDLERRYEVLKRRMSSRYFETKTLHKESVSSELKHTDRRVDNEDYSQISSSKKSPPSIENLEERFEKLQTKSEAKSTNSTQSPPSTENLEERFEKLQNKPDPKDAKKPQSTTADESQDDRTDNQIIERKKSNTTEPDFVSPTEKEVEVPGETGSDEVKDDINRQESRSASAENYPAQNDMKNSKNKVEASDDNMNSETPSKMFQKKVGEISEKKKTLDLLSKNANKIKIKLIEELQAKIKEHSKDADESLEKKNAVIEELKTKIKPLPDEFLKPTSISSRRRPQSQNTLLQSLSFNDETLESHATSANRKLGKHEPSSTANRKMVRRFSDLPSRADLENRLQFLEEQLSKTVCMQRRASDSEVASRAHLQSRSPVPDSLEFRVQELEKRLKDNRTISMDVECSSANEKNEPDIEISQVELATNSAAVTGKELVRYSSHGEMSDMERQNPINISINIQMTINKEEIGMKKNTEDSKADDLDKRLQILEQRLKTSLTVGEKTADREKDMKLKDLADEEEKVNNQVAGDASAKDVTVQNGLTSEDFDHSSSSNKADEHTTNDKLSETDSSGVAENSGNIKEETKGTDANKTSGEIEEEVQVIEENKKIESTEPEQTEIQKNSQEQKLKENKEEKGIKDDIPKCITKKTEKVEVLKSNGEPTTTKSVESNTKEDKNIINALQQKPQSQTDEVIDPREVVAVKETPMPQENKTAEPKSFEPDEIETIKVVESSEVKTSSEIEKCIGLNKGSQIVPVEVNKKTLVLLLDNEPKAVKVRRLTRANTEELEGLFQALEKQLNDRGLHKSLKTDSEEKSQIETEACKAMLDLAKEIEQFSKNEPIKSEEKEKPTQPKETKPEEEFDWGSDPIKRHLKRRTVHLPSTKELEARFRSLERQIKLFEDVEKINVEHRLTEIERKIKLQYSLSHEKDLNKFLELCEGKDPDEVLGLENPQERRDYCEDHKQSARNPSPNRLKEQSCNIKQYYHPPDLKRTKSKQSLKKQPIHPLEMLLDPSPDERDIPTTGELEHRIRVMNETHYSPSPPSRKSRSQSPPLKQNQAKSNIHFLEQMTASPEERELPTAEQLEARLEALEREQSFNFKMQKDFQQFNQKLKDVVSPSLSFDEFKSTKTSESAQIKEQVSSIAKQTKNVRAISPKTIHFYGEESPKKRVESKKPFSEGGESQQLSASREGLGVMGNRLMRETSPLRRKGTHTGVPLRTGENINDQLTSIQNTIKSIDSLCEEKPYRKERCQQYIDSLCSDSTYFAHKKASLEDLTSRNLSRSTSREIGPSIKVSDHSPVFSRSMGSADSIRSSSPLRPTSPLQYRSNRDLRREPSPRRRREEDREEHESRVRRDNLLPNNFNYSHSRLSHTSHSSLTKFHKVDSQLIPNGVEIEHELEYEDSLRHPTYSTVDDLIYHDNTNTSNNVNTTSQRIFRADVKAPDILSSQTLERPMLPFCQSFPSTSNTPAYTPAKLEIRHTTVTSTFYDRVLTEKQLEKQHHLSFSSNNQSPMISPQFEKNAKPIFQQQTTKSPTKLYATDPINKLTLSEDSTGNYHRSFQLHNQANNHS